MSVTRESLAKLRADLLGIDQEIRKLGAIARHPDDIAAEVLGELERMAAESTVDYWARELCLHKRHGIWALDRVLKEQVQMNLGDLVALIGPAAACEGIMERVAGQMPRGEKPMREIDRQARIAELKAKRRQIETAEEIALMALEDAGDVIARRPNADPELLLELWK